MWFKNLRIYRLDTVFSLSAQQLTELLAKHQFAPCGSQEPLSLGWIQPREGGEREQANMRYLRFDLADATRCGVQKAAHYRHP